MSRKLLDQQDLIGIFTIKPVRGMYQYRFNLPLGGQVTQSLQCRPDKRSTTLTLVLKNPLLGYRITLIVTVFHQS